MTIWGTISRWDWRAALAMCSKEPIGFRFIRALALKTRRKRCFSVRIKRTRRINYLNIRYKNKEASRTINNCSQFSADLILHALEVSKNTSIKKIRQSLLLKLIPDTLPLYHKYQWCSTNSSKILTLRLSTCSTPFSPLNSRSKQPLNHSRKKQSTSKELSKLFCEYCLLHWVKN